MRLSLNLVILSLIASGAYGAPMLKKRIAQVISASTAKWEQACLAAGGDQRCNPVSVTAFGTLLAAPGPCEQQNAADKMIDLAKQLNNDPEMIRLTQIFVQQPRNTPTSQSVPYCQQAPRNAELNGLFQCQFAGADLSVFVGGLAIGQPGSIPFDKTASINPAGSCPAHTSGPIADGSQLVDIIQDPGVGSTSSGSTSPTTTVTSASKPSSTTEASTSTISSSTASGSSDSSSPVPSTVNTATTSASTSDSSSCASSAASIPPASASGDFRLQNGKDAQSLNAKFVSLTLDSACTTGDVACIGGSFAQCANGKFVVSPCPATLTCAALPLVNKPGTSVTCTTAADATARIAATGATGGITSA